MSINTPMKDSDVNKWLNKTTGLPDPCNGIVCSESEKINLQVICADSGLPINPTNLNYLFNKLSNYEINNYCKHSEENRNKVCKNIRKMMAADERTFKTIIKQEIKPDIKTAMAPLSDLLEKNRRGDVPNTPQEESDIDTIARTLGAPFKLEKPAGTSMHHLIDWMEQTKAYQAKADNEMLVLLKSGAFQSFVIEHDWAKAFEGVKDFEGGEIKLPYEFTCFEFKVSGIRILMLLDDASEGIRGFMCVGINKRWYLNANTIQFKDGEMHFRVPFADKEGEKMIRAWMKNLSDQVRAVSIMLDAGVAVADIRSHGGEGLNKQRIKAGKCPLSDYHVVVLAKRLRKEHDRGEPTGIKKRLHWRRGHYRHFHTPGGQIKFIDQDGITRSKTWINWQLVGDENLGFVDKHYRL